jgi:hypothetical protein
MTHSADFETAAARMRTKRRQAEQREAHYHEARILLLITQFTTPKSGLAGLTKLAKLDFLLRYPAMLERLLPAGEASWPAGTAPTPPERHAVESRMTRYKYGPWDQRYYSARAEFRATPQGAAAAASLAATPEWAVVDNRIRLLKRQFNKSGSALKNLIYDRLPDAVDRPWRTEI